MAERAPSVVMVLEATFPRHGGGGAESQVLTLGRTLLAKGLRVQVLVPMVATGRQVARESVEGLEVTRIAYPRIPLLGAAVMLARLAWWLARERRDYDAIHAHIAHNMAAVSAVTGRLLGKRVIVKLTGMREMAGGILDARPGFASRVRKWAVGRAALVQATSGRLRALLVDRGFDERRVLLLPNGIDVERFVGTPRDAGLRSSLCGEARIAGVYVGRLAPEKGHALLLDAWAQVFGGRGDACLVLVGDGPERAELEARAARLGIGKQVAFAGHSEDVGRYLAMADFGLLTSHAEGLSNSLLEYMAAGLPVVGSRVSGTEDIVVTGENGWLFEPGSVGGLAQCLERVGATEPAALRRMGVRAREGVAASASLGVVARELVRCYGLEAEPAPRPA